MRFFLFYSFSTPSCYYGLSCSSFCSSSSSYCSSYSCDCRCCCSSISTHLFLVTLCFTFSIQVLSSHLSVFTRTIFSLLYHLFLSYKLQSSHSRFYNVVSYARHTSSRCYYFWPDHLNCLTILLMPVHILAFSRFSVRTTTQRPPARLRLPTKSTRPWCRLTFSCPTTRPRSSSTVTPPCGTAWNTF